LLTYILLAQTIELIYYFMAYSYTIHKRCL
jgi:hypothetical protein